MELQHGSYYEIAADELAKWLDDQGDEAYWTVDGDPVLSGRLSFPCPGDELAAALREIGSPLFVFDPADTGQLDKGIVDASRLGELVDEEELETRVLQLCWKDSNRIWLLVEDEETSESEWREASNQ